MSPHSAWNCVTSWHLDFFFSLSLAVTNLKNRQIYQMFTKILYDVEAFMLGLCMSLHLNLGLILRLMDETQSFLSYLIVRNMT